MTLARLKKTGRAYSVSCRGHAVGAPDVCAAVSCLLYTAAGYLRNTPGAETRALRLHSGDAYICFCGEGAKELFRMLDIGLRQIEKANPGAIEVEEQTAP